MPPHADLYFGWAPAERGAQLANFLKNVSLIGGLLLATGWRGAP